MDKIGVFFFKSGSESSVGFNTIKRKISEICGICVSPQKQWDLCEP